MSGFEAVAAVLGLWPVVKKSINSYKAAKGIPAFELSQHELEIEEFKFQESIHKLFSPDIKKYGLIQPNGSKRPNMDFLGDKALLSKLEQRLGLAKTELVLTAIMEIEKALNSLSELLVNETFSKKPSGKLRTSIRNYFNPQQNFKPSLENLRLNNVRLGMLLTSYERSNVYALGGPQDSLPSEDLNRVSAHARHLYDTLLDGFRCNCPFPHLVGLGLYKSLPGDTDGDQVFELLISVDEAVTGRNLEPSDSLPLPLRENTEKDVEYSDSLWTSNPSRRSGSPTTRSGNVLPPRIEPSNTVPDNSRELSLSFESVPDIESKANSKVERRIDDLCTFIKNLDDPPNSVPTPSLHILKSNKEQYTVRAYSLSTMSSAVCLEDYLAPFQKWEITRKGRMDLALSLSLAILSFHSTPWIDECWTWKDFYTLKNDKSRIFITKAFYGAHAASQKPLLQITPQSHRCLALVELALGKRLSELREPSDIPNQDQDMIDVQTAKDLLSSGNVSQEAGQIYHDAAEACLSHSVIRSSCVISLNSNHLNFQQDLERFVVAPLRDLHIATWGQIFDGNSHADLDFAPETIQTSLDLKLNLNSPLEINQTETGWITYESEILEVIRLRHRQGEQQTSLAETLKTIIVLTGYDSHFEAATCEEYLKREWGSLGIELLDLIISAIGNSPESSSTGRSISNISVESNMLSIFCRPNLSRTERDSIIEALDWLCRAIRIPASPGNLSISSSNRELIRSAVSGSKVPQNISPRPNERSMLSDSDFQLSFCLQKLYPLPKSQELCWRALFESGVVAMRSRDREPELRNNVFARGLEISFELMVQLSAVELPVLVDEGIVLVKYQTALVPISGSKKFVQWHLETSESGRINPYELESTKKLWLKQRDWKSFKNKRCFVGWCSSAHINLGTSILTEQVGWSDCKVQKKTLHWSGISLGCQAATTNPVQLGFTAQANFSFAPNKVNFTPSNNFARLLRDTSKEVAAVIDCLNGRSWIVPRLSLMLHMVHAWSSRNGIDPDPIPYAEPCHDGSQAELVLRESGDLILLGKGQDTLTLRQLMLGIDVNLIQSRHQTEDAASGKVFGFEFMDIVCEPPMGGNMKRVSIKSPGKCWSHVVNKADAVVLCANLGQAITPVDENNQRNPNCNILPPNSGYLAVPLPCLTQIILRQGRQDPDLNAKQNTIFKISDDHFWKISGNPFEDCTHSGQQTQSCWERGNLLQKLTKRGSLNDMLKEGKQIRACMHIYPSGAVVFGERSDRTTVYSIRRFLTGENLIDVTVEEKSDVINHE